MEKNLGWIVGGVGALLIGAMVPVVAFASPINSVASNAKAPVTTVQTASGTATSATTAVSAGNQSAASQNPGVQTSLSQKVQYADKVATSAVGGGTVTNATIDNAGTSPVWTVTVQQASGSYQVQISVPNYTVISTQQSN